MLSLLLRAWSIRTGPQRRRMRTDQALHYTFCGTHSEQIPLLSCGFKLYFFVLPAFYVELPTVAADDVPLPPPTRLRIASAGVWHNLVLALAVWILAGGEARDAGLEAGLGMSRKVGEGLGLWETLDDGVVVTAVSAVSLFCMFRASRRSPDSRQPAHHLCYAGLGVGATSPAGDENHAPRRPGARTRFSPRRRLHPLDHRPLATFPALDPCSWRLYEPWLVSR